MFGRFLPKETSFFEFFERHAAVTGEGAREFLSLSEPLVNVHAKVRRIKELEHEADVITHDCVEALHKTFITPIERDDIHRLITRMDDIMDYVDEASERISLYEIHEFTPELRSMAEILVRATEQILGAVKGLRNMKNAAPVRRACVDINHLENQGDGIYQRAVARLFKEERDPIAVIKWKEMYESLENAVDRCEDVANTLDGIVLEHA
ncbi:MAG: DUF47 domain-containing protein [Planctomycetota bacterium]|nr:MAG: DUF47 domain-containing protein [Planctomycetota bacterium]